MKIGFTGSRVQPSNFQIAWLYETLEKGGIDELHHGQCVGADAVAHRAAVENGIPVFVHPPTNPRLIAQDVVKRPGVTFLPAEPYLNRNRKIVGDTDGLLALPSEPENESGGTWYTVHFAQRMNKPVVICYKHGKIETRDALNMEGINQE